MSYEIARGERPGAAARRLVGEQLDAVHAALSSATPEDRAEAVHDSRKRLKRVRTVVRLVRGTLGRERYARENEAFRDAGRRLSAVRDAEVLMAALETVADALPEGRKRSLRAALAERREAAVHRAFVERDEPAWVLGDLAEARGRLADWPDGDDGWHDLGAGLGRIYSRGRHAMREAYDHPTAERFHEWRKRSKDLWHALLLVRPLWPEVVERTAREARALSEVLGDDHDLAALQDGLFAADPPLVPPIGRGRVEAAIRARSEALRLQAEPLGARLYAEKPAAFDARFRAWWHAWGRDA